MYLVKVKFPCNIDSNKEKQISLINSLIGAWRHNGQILGKENLITEVEDYFILFVNTPEKDSLSCKYDNLYVKELYKKILEIGVLSPIINVIGREAESLQECECKSSTYYILYTTFLSVGTPVMCGDCSGTIPLYKLPKTQAEDYYDIIKWQEDYRSCDTLQMNCSVGNRFATQQLSKLNSSLSKQGMEVCKKIAKSTKTKVYYYLHKTERSDSFTKAILEKCPNCSNSWYREKPIHKIFDFVCDECCLLSNIA